MAKQQFNVIGVMSGTSLDGIDLAYITFNKDATWKFEIHLAETVPYDNHWIETLKNLTLLSISALAELDEHYTLYLCGIIESFIKKHQISVLDAVCSHGHTALHQPHNRLTYQIGNLPKMATLLNQKIVCDFRVEDVALGGQGAPLVPIGDELLFSEYDFCLNLGGFANVSTKIDGDRIAYDICPINIVLNYYVNHLGLNYDDKGKLASEGKISKQLLTQLNGLSFYRQSFPKSLGLEWVKTEIIPLINSFNLSTRDVLRTFVEHAAMQICNEINTKTNATVLITGGGAYNDFLIERIERKTPNQIVIPAPDIVEFKEALIFGLLGVLRLRNEINCLKRVTGASKNHSSGKIYCP
ncbi:MAG TPA: anhydro-N-acetylmuramic acid kinase [Aquaticitalea sp.]|nr:anhydro-N-acetylmuramic acid kinase [Aquaticitalea sp.]